MQIWNNLIVKPSKITGYGEAKSYGAPLHFFGSASTVAGDPDARRVAGRQSVSTIASATRANSAVGRQSVSIIVTAIAVRNVAACPSVNTIVGAMSAKSAELL